jgi:hypothetical protein
MLYTGLLILAIWVVISFIVSLPLAKMMHIGSGEGPKGLLKDDDPALKGRRRSRNRTRPKPAADLPARKQQKDVVFR